MELTSKSGSVSANLKVPVTSKEKKIPHNIVNEMNNEKYNLGGLSGSENDDLNSEVDLNPQQI